MGRNRFDEFECLRVSDFNWSDKLEFPREFSFNWFDKLDSERCGLAEYPEVCKRDALS